MIGSSHPHQTHTRSTSYIYNALGILYMSWALIWVCPYSTIIMLSYKISLGQVWLAIMVKVMVCCEFGPQTTDTQMSQWYIYIDASCLGYFKYLYLLWYRCNHIHYMWEPPTLTTHHCHYPSWLVWYCNVIAVCKDKDKAKMRWMRHRTITLV